MQPRTQNILFFLRPPSLTGHIFEALWAMVMNISSLKSPKPYQFPKFSRIYKILQCSALFDPKILKTCTIKQEPRKPSIQSSIHTTRISFSRMTFVIKKLRAYNSETVKTLISSMSSNIYVRAPFKECNIKDFFPILGNLRHPIPKIGDLFTFVLSMVLITPKKLTSLLTDLKTLQLLLPRKLRKRKTGELRSDWVLQKRLSSKHTMVTEARSRPEAREDWNVDAPPLPSPPPRLPIVAL